VLSSLTELNGKKIVARGVWEQGDAMRILRSEGPCEHPTIRDGWLWADIIDLVPESGKLSVAEYVAEYRRFRTQYPRHRIIATLTGRLETRERYEVWTTPFGVQLPRGFGRWAAAQLRFVRADHLTAVPYTDKELEEGIGRSYNPRRVP
jgi:hypothetical protein